MGDGGRERRGARFLREIKKIESFLPDSGSVNLPSLWRTVWHDFLKRDLHLDPDPAASRLGICPLIGHRETVARVTSPQLCPQSLTWAQCKGHKQESKWVN